MKRESRNLWYVYIMPFISALLIVLHGLIMKYNGVELGKLVIVTLVLTSIVVYYVLWNKDKMLQNNIHKIVVVGGYLLSLLCVVIVPSNQHLLWLLGGLVVGMILDYRIGFLYQFNMIIILTLAQGLRSEELLQLMITAVVIQLLSSYMKEIRTLIYSSVIVISLHITLSFIMNNFMYSSKQGADYINSIISILLVNSISFVLNRLFAGNTKMVSIIEDETTEEDMPTLWASYDVLLGENNGLLVKLREYSESAYEQSLRLSDLTFRAAKHIGGNEYLAKAAGLYHRIGEIRGVDNLVSTLSVASDYSFPKDLMELLRQYHGKVQKPTTAEGVILAVSWDIVRIMEALSRKEGGKYDTDQIVDGIFQKSLHDGKLDQSNLSVKEYNQLKEFYKEELKLINPSLQQ